VSDAAGPYGGVNPPPNDGAGFSPPIGAGAASPPRVGLIVKKDAAGRWMDDNGGNWTEMVSGEQAAKSGRLPGWDLPDRDIAIIDTSSLSVDYQSRLMSINMAIAVNPASGEVAVVGTEATNEIRFEPNVRGTFVRVHLARFPPGGGASISDLNPHLDYSVRSVPQTERDKSIGDPRAIVFNSAGTRAYVSGMGSNNVIVLDGAGARAGLADTIEVGEGPIGLALDEPAGRLFVHNRFEGSISVVDLSTEQEVARVAYHDPTPDGIRRGRPHFYSTHATSGLGQASCASCHVDGRMDRLAWDLGDPQGVRQSLAGRNLGAGIPGLEPSTTPVAFAPHHPMKGPMTTQTLQDIIGHEPHHWRGDRDGLEAFAGAFVGLNGADELPSALQMQEFEDFLATITFPPNPFRNFDNTLPANLPLPGHFRSGRFGSAGQPLPAGNAERGLALYLRTGPGVGLDSPFGCVTCHTLPTGMSTDMTFSGGRFMEFAPGPMGEHHLALVSVDGSTNRAFKTPQLRNMYEKVGFDATQTTSRAGFGYLHDGSVDSLARFVSEPAFSVGSDQQVADLIAFLLAFSGSDLPTGSIFNLLSPPGTLSQDTHAAVGAQTTVVDGAAIPLGQRELLDGMLALAGAGAVDIIVKGPAGAEQRGWVYDAGGFQSDRAGQISSPAALQALARPGAELTWTVVSAGSGVRLGVDRDGDGFLDGDERAVCADPADPESYPGGPGSADCDADFILSFFDFLCFQNAFAAGELEADCDRDGGLTFFDFLCFQDAFAGCG
jgi:mono/diheme cytochrome c family protein